MRIRAFLATTGVTLAVASAALAEVTLFAAASLTTALEEIVPVNASPPVSLSFAGSSTLARQIDAGAPADLFVSAHREWMDYLEERGRIDATTRFDLLANRLVVIAPSGTGLVVEPHRDFDFAATFDGRLALGDPDHVPAGIYTRQALQRLGWWSRVRERLAPAPDVRAALVFVERGECAAGIVYATDAAISRKVEVVATIPDSLQPPIRYSAAVVKGRDSAAVRKVMLYLRSSVAADVFRRHGFILLRRPKPVRSVPE